MNSHYRLNTTGFLMNIKGSSGVTLKKLNTFDWLCDLPEAQSATDFVEVQFKNTRKGYYLNSNKIPLVKGDWVAVESIPGHDIGVVTLTGQLVLKQMKKTRYRFDQEVKRVYRKARPVDMEKYEESKAREHDTMLRSRKIAEDLHLDMKIGDVEYQGDGNKAIFYYIADGRVDFRELIKVLADNFHVRIEMKQIGARQEAGRIGGLGPCGREMCCSSWMTNFVSVSTGAARVQDLSLNPQKLAGQCAKLKCCLNYETDVYAEAQKEFPSKDITLETIDGTYYQVKTDILAHTITYSTAKDSMSNLTTLSLERAWQIIHLNRQGQKVESLTGETPSASPRTGFGDILGSNDYTRFDKPRGKKGHSRDNRGHRDNRDNRGGNRPERDNRDNRENRENRENRGNRENRENRENRGNRPERNNRPERRAEDGRNGGRHNGNNGRPKGPANGNTPHGGGPANTGVNSPANPPANE